MIGTTVLQYRITGRLGEGGMGEVYVAHDTDLDRPVALKFLSQRFTSHTEARTRFEREARAAAALDDANIVAIYEIGEHEGRPFIAMPYVEGEILSDIIARGPLPAARAVDIARQIARGLARAHRAGIVHRDIKPGNILIDNNGCVKILDFGLAIVDADTRVTAQTTTIGTVHYMSPEQARGDEVDGRSDIFSLGSVFYEMLTGRLPFGGDRAATVLYAIEKARPANPSDVNPDVPPGLDRVVARMLAKKADDRYASAESVVADLGGGPRRASGPVPVRRKDRRPWLAGLGLVVVIAVAAFLWRSAIRPGPPGGGPAAGGLTKIAVLPFENLGAPENEYLADGITEEITGRLAMVEGLGVISRTSTLQYKATRKSIKQIGRELGVDYVLEGTIRWGGAEAGRVRITPELIRVSDETNLWTQPFDRVATDLFRIQSEIAEQVARKLDIALAESARARIAMQPTESFEAYQAYRRGVAAARSAPYSRDDMELAIAMFERAVALDPQFALAYAQLSRVHSEMFHMGFHRTEHRLALARAAADRALELDPQLPEARLSLAYFHYWGAKAYDAALAELDAARRYGAREGEVLEARGYILRRQGRYGEAAEALETAFELSPRDDMLALEVANTHLGLWQFAEAQSFYDLSISLRPDMIAPYTLEVRNLLLWKGDLAATRRVLDEMPESHELRPVWFRAFQALCEGRDQEVVDELEPYRTRTYETHAQSVPVALMLAWAHERLGDTESAARDYEEARAALAATLAERPDDFRVHMALGLVDAGLGRHAEALRHGERALALNPMAVDAWSGPILQRNWLFLLARVGETDAALEQLAYLVSFPNPGGSPALFRIEPRLETLRRDPRFEEILAGTPAAGGSRP